MLVEGLTIAMLLDLAKIASALSFIGGLLFGVFKVINWVKTKLSSIDSNVVELRNSMDANFTGLRDDIKAQTNTIATALSEQRQDFRTFYAPSLMMMMQQNHVASVLSAAVPAKAKRAPRRQTKKK
jgi:hypothetical protein